MDFSYYDNNNQIKKLDIKIGSKWSENKTGNVYLDSIFKAADNGDGVVQEDEFLILQHLFRNADNLMGEKYNDKVLTNDELILLKNKLKNKELNMDKLKNGEIDTIDPDDYKLENLKKRFPEDKYEYEIYNDGDIFITDKKSMKLVLSFIYIWRNNKVPNIHLYIQDGDVSISGEYSFEGKLLHCLGKDTKFHGNSSDEDFERLLQLNEDTYNKVDLLKEVNRILERINPENIQFFYEDFYKNTEKTFDEMFEASPLLKNNHYIREKIRNHLNKCLEEYYGYKHDFKNENSQVVNKFHTGDSYTVDCRNEKMTIINKKTGKKKTLDLNKIVSELPLDKQVQVKKWLLEQPGELLMDLATETGKLKSFLKESVLMKVWMKKENAAAWYSKDTDSITLGAAGYDAGWARGIAHELGHAMDEINDEYLSDKYDEFKEAFTNGREAFVNAGHKPCKSSKDVNHCEYGNVVAIGSNYATANIKEMFAECYTYLMTGTCQSAAMLEDFFPDCLRIANEMIEEIRALPDEVRHKK